MSRPRTHRKKKSPDTPPPPPPPPPAAAPPEPAAATPAEHHPQTHAFAYGADNVMRCPCGAEQELKLVDGKAARVYRADAATPWGPAIAVCPKYVPPAPPAPPPAKEASKEQGGLAKALTDALRKQNPGMFEPEIIDGCDVEKAAEDVMLDVACSPVLRRARAGVCPESDERAAAMVPIEVSPLGGDMYRVFFEEGPRDMPAEMVKIMRARFLLQRQALSKALYQMHEPARSRWAKLYNITWLPPEGSPLHQQMMTGEVITIPRDGDAPVDFLAVMKQLSTPGATIPAVCPTLPQEPPPQPEGP